MRTRLKVDPVWEQFWIAQASWGWGRPQNAPMKFRTNEANMRSVRAFRRQGTRRRGSPPVEISWSKYKTPPGAICYQLDGPHTSHHTQTIILRELTAALYPRPDPYSRINFHQPVVIFGTICQPAVLLMTHTMKMRATVIKACRFGWKVKARPPFKA